MPAAPGIYIIRHEGSGKEYVGQAVNLKVRSQHHVRHLVRGTHANRHLLSYWQKYGAQAFTIRVAELLSAEKSALDAAEQKYLDTNNFAFNHNRKANSMLGYRFSEDQKRQRREKIKCAMNRPEVKARLSQCARQQHARNKC